MLNSKTDNEGQTSHMDRNCIEDPTTSMPHPLGEKLHLDETIADKEAHIQRCAAKEGWMKEMGKYNFFIYSPIYKNPL